MLEKQQQPEACIVINDACDLDVVEPFTITLLQIYFWVCFEKKKCKLVNLRRSYG